MKTVTLKLPDTLNAKIRRVLAKRKETFSELARRALAREVENEESDFARLAAPYRGMFRGPGDLSVREGYGDRDAG
jgi:predicted transcriptional regulator